VRFCEMACRRPQVDKTVGIEVLKGPIRAI
jgi:hypothetical protein